MKKRKITALILLVAVVIGMFAGCNNAATEEQSSEVSLSPIEISKENSKHISSFGRQFVGLRKDGTVVGKSMDSDYKDEYGSLKISNWEDIVAVSAGPGHTVGLKSDGTCVATGYNDDGRCDVYDWTDIVEVVSGNHHTVGLKSNGRVLSVGSNHYGQTNVNDWVDIVDIYAGSSQTVGVKADGTIIAVGYGTDTLEWMNVCGVFKWTDIVKILCLNDEEIIGLKSDGTLVFAGDYDSSNEEHANKLRKSHKYMSQWEDIVAISSLIHDGDYIGLKSDGTLLHTAGVTSVHGEDNHFNYINIDDCNDIIAISGRYLLRSNGDVVFIKDAKNLNDFLTNKSNSKYLTQSTGINLFS